MSTQDLSDFVAKPSKSPRSMGTGVIVHSLAWCVVFGLLAFAVPKFEAIFKDFGVDLPVFAKITIKASHFLIDYLFVLAPLIIMFLVVDGFILANPRRGKEIGKSWTWSVLMLGTALLAILFILTSIGIPLINLSQKLSG